MARILILISLTLLIVIALSLASKPDGSASNESHDKGASSEEHNKGKKGVKHSDSDKHEKHEDKHKKHKHSRAKSNEDHSSQNHERESRHGDHGNESQEKNNHHESSESNESHKKHDKDDNHDSKHKKHSKHSSKDKKHHGRHSDHKHKKSDSKNLISDASDDEGWEYENSAAVDTRRILYSKSTPKGRRPYMVYLQLTKESAKAHKYRGWLCGGVIVERYYVLTSAACVEDADHFYIVSGTTKFVDSFDYKNDDCVCNNRRKVVWKCIPKNYKFDFQDSIKWSSNDIAIVKVNKPFKFGVIEKGCEFAADLICYNNISRDLEKPGTKGWIAGWGSGSNFREGVYRKATPHVPDNAKCLQEAKVCIMDNEQCAKKWSQRFRNIITQYMICTKDVMKRLSEICDKRYANCTDVESRKKFEAIDVDERSNEIDLGRHLLNPDDYTARRSNQGGFCENDHGGPLIVKYQNKERVIGVISACKIDPKTHSCHGPFLYTSVFKNRQFISCSIYKDTEETCRRVFRTGITHEEWTVDWDNVKEDDDDRKDDDDDRKQNDDEDSDSSSDSVSKETLRESKNEDKKESKSSARDVIPSSGSSIEVKEQSKTKQKGNSSEKKDKSVSEEKKQSKKKLKSSALKDSSSDSSTSSEEIRRNLNDNRELFYESSPDENVNEPGSNE